MSALNQACLIIAEVGCFADLSIANSDEFDHLDREGRIKAAGDVLVDFVAEWFADETGELPFHRRAVRSIAALVARAMMAQYEHDEKEAHFLEEVAA
jgi:hypothetical protein